MKIRSITGFCAGLDVVDTAAGFLTRARAAYVDAGFEVQTVRVALPPLSSLVDPARSGDALVDLARELEGRAHDHGIDYAALGPHRPGDPHRWAEALPRILDETQRVFVTLGLDDAHGQLFADQAAHAADAILAAAPIEPNGFANLRFSALARVPAGVPFLPAAYATPGMPTEFAVATEAADLARGAFAEAPSPVRAVDRLVAVIEETAASIESVARTLERSGVARFGGIDFSPAPFPRDADSIGATIESMGIEAVGRPGSVAASAMITSALDRARFPRTGFSGLFLPVLEDDTLARRAAQGSLRIEDLLLASTVCGTGLDTVPLPGDVDAESLTACLLDLGALALRLEKPLTARLMPMPGRAAGEPLDFDFPFFASGAVMPLRPGRVDGLLRRGPLPITPRRRRDA